MKTSNKLLIIFVLLMFVTPLSIVAYMAANSHLAVDEDAAFGKSIQRFNTPSKYHASIAIAVPFQSIAIPDGKKRDWVIVFVKDNQRGVKVAEELKNLITTRVDTKGVLQLGVKANMGKEEQDLFNQSLLKVYVYTPHLSGMEINAAARLSLQATTDTLALYLRNVDDIFLGEDFGVQNLKLDLHEVRDITISKTALNSLEVNLQSTLFRSRLDSCGQMKINASGNADVYLSGAADRDDRTSRIGSLDIQTKGTVKLTMDQLRASSVSGRLSDETTVAMPVAYLRRMMR